MQVDFMTLWSFVVDDCVNVLDVKTTGSEICGQEIVDFA
jgi:hypothetical protein